MTTARDDQREGDRRVAEHNPGESTDPVVHIRAGRSSGDASFTRRMMLHSLGEWSFCQCLHSLVLSFYPWLLWIGTASSESKYLLIPMNESTAVHIETGYD